MIIVSSLPIAVKVGKYYEYAFWTIQKKVTLRSPYPIRVGEAIKIVKIDEENLIIDVFPDDVNVEEDSDIRILSMCSNHMPLSDKDEYEINYTNCEPLMVATARDGRGNKCIMFCVLSSSNYSNVYGICKATNDRFVFNIKFSNADLSTAHRRISDDIRSRLENTLARS